MSANPYRTEVSGRMVDLTTGRASIEVQWMENGERRSATVETTVTVENGRLDAVWPEADIPPAVLMYALVVIETGDPGGDDQ